MVTLVPNLGFPSQGSVWQLLDEVSVAEKDSESSVETGFSTEPKSRREDAYVGEVETVGTGSDALRLNELR
jgi:hypothetical protein